MSDDKSKDKGKGKNADAGDDNKPKATDKELGELVKAQAKRIEQLEAENKGMSDLKGQVEALQNDRDAKGAFAELMDQIKALKEGQEGEPMTEAEKHASALLKAAESGNMKEFRRLRTQQA